jgi:hypothetical protein
MSDSDAELLTEARRASVRHTLMSHLDARATAPVAAALVSLRADGSFDILTADIEPEFIDSMVDGLENLAEQLRWHALRTRRRRTRRDAGATTLLALVPILFAVATYINEVAWVDSALNLAAQLTTALIAGRRRSP